ncbi:hypothetical protein ACFONI_12480 [Aeromonas media]|uniref:hypothetical protein n=1 Tax=Aeromonas media TaxID=651 RepID=UPI00361785DA
MVPDCPTAEGSVNGSLTDQHCPTIRALRPDGDLPVSLLSYDFSVVRSGFNAPE